MSASVKIVLHGKEYSDGTHAVMLQCLVSTPTNKVIKRRTLCKVMPHQFDAKNGRIIKHQNVLILNARITDALRSAEEKLHAALLQKRKVVPSDIISADNFTGSKESFLLVHMELYINRCEQKGQVHTAEKYNGHLKKIAAFLGKTREGDQVDLPLEDVTEDWILKLSYWLKENGCKSPNTLHRRMAFLKTVLTDARKRGLLKSDPMAFLEFKEQRVRKPKLTPEQLMQIEELELTGRLADIRNTFLLQYYAFGSRISDALTWKKEDVVKEGETWYLHYASMKTGDLIDVRLNAKAKELVSYYLQTTPGKFLLPWLSKFEIVPGWSIVENRKRIIAQIESKTQMINFGLKQIAKQAGLQLNLTTHIARHTFANIADKRVSDKRKISAALGHSKFSTTEVYLAELRQSDINDAMEEVWK